MIDFLESKLKTEELNLDSCKHSWYLKFIVKCVENVENSPLILKLLSTLINTGNPQLKKHFNVLQTYYENQNLDENEAKLGEIWEILLF